MIRVSIIEDNRQTAQSFVSLSRHSAEIICLATYADAETAELELPKLKPDVVLVDIHLPRCSGVECVVRLKRAYPEIKFLMLTAYDNSDLIFDSLRGGASGFLLKRFAAEELVDAIIEVHRGGSPMSMQIARKVVTHFHNIRNPTGDMEQLTRREQEILGLLAEGLGDKQIAARLFISPSTVRGHLHTIYGKLHVQSRTEAIVRFLDT